MSLREDHGVLRPERRRWGVLVTLIIKPPRFRRGTGDSEDAQSGKAFGYSYSSASTVPKVLTVGLSYCDTKDATPNPRALHYPVQQAGKECSCGD